MNLQTTFFRLCLNAGSAMWLILQTAAADSTQPMPVLAYHDCEADGLRKGDQPDLVVQTAERLQRRHMQFDQQWQWRQIAGSDRLVSELSDTRDYIARACLSVMMRKTTVDFGLWWGPDDKLFYNHDFNILEAYDPTSYTQADIRCKSLPMTSMTGYVSGAELRDIYDRWVVKLGSRRKLLRHVEEGPIATPEDVLREMF